MRTFHIGGAAFAYRCGGQCPPVKTAGIDPVATTSSQLKHADGSLVAVSRSGELAGA